jgi:hypothetical protein
MSDERLLRRLGRSALWAPRRFFDPRFDGLAGQASDLHSSTVDQLRDVVDHVDTGREEATAHRESIEMRIAQLREVVEQQIRAETAATTMLGRSLAEQRAVLESLGAGGGEPSAERVAGPAYALRALAAAPRGARVLEVGAADGTLALSLASLGYQVTALSPGAAVAHPNLRSIAGDLTTLEDDPFDAAVCLSKPDADAVRRLGELLVPGGVLVLAAPYDRSRLEQALDGFAVEDVTVLRSAAPGVWVTSSADDVDGDGVALVTARTS